MDPVDPMEIAMSISIKPVNLHQISDNVEFSLIFPATEAHGSMQVQARVLVLD